MADTFTVDLDALARAVDDEHIDPDPRIEPLTAFSESGADRALELLFGDAEDHGAITGPDGLQLHVYTVGGPTDLGTLVALRRCRGNEQVSALSVDTDDLCDIHAPAVQALAAVCAHATERLLPLADRLPPVEA